MPVKYILIVFCALSFLFLAACSENRISERCQTSDAAGQHAAQKYAKLQAKIQSILDEAVAKNWQNAAQCCIYIDGVLAVDAWAGYYDKDKKRKIDGNSLFPIYSTGKPILATAVNRAVEMGKLDYDMKISSVWREFGRNGKENITLRHVITHHSGLQSSPNAGTTHEQYCDWRYMVKQCENFKPLCEAGSKMRYLSQTYAWLLGEPLARAMNMPIRDALVKLVLEPAGIEKDFFFPMDSTVTIFAGKTSSLTFKMKSTIKPKEPRRTLVMAEVGYHPSQISFGAMVGIVSKNGAYLRFRSDFGSASTELECDDTGALSNGAGTPYYKEGVTTKARMSITAGYLRQIIKPLYAYIGAGYGNRVLAWETIDGELVKNTDHSATGVAAELGAIGRLGQFAVSVGFQTVNFKYHELSAGIGFFF